MKIFYDPTEAREGTRLTSGIIQAGQSLPGLEAKTGADLLVSPLDIPLETIDDSLPSQVAFRKHCEEGALVQRKSGMDLISSIPKLATIQAKMQMHSNQVWLLVVGTFFCTEDGQMSVDHYKTGFSYNSVMGALNWWQLRGGSVVQICSEIHVGAWVRLLTESLAKATKEKEQIIQQKPLLQRVMADGGYWQDDTEIAARLTLATFPGMGPHKAKLMAEKFGTLGKCIAILSNVRLWEHTPKGIGFKTLELARKWIGMTDGVILESRGMFSKEFREIHSKLVGDKDYQYDWKGDEEC